MGDGVERGVQSFSLGIEEIPAAVVIVEAASSLLVAANRRARALFGLEQPRLPKITLGALLGACQDQAGRDRSLAGLLAGRPPHQLDCRLPPRAGTPRVIRICAPSLPDGDGRMVLTVSDRTRDAEQLDQLVSAELRLMALIEATVDAYYDWHISTDINDFSLQIDRLLGLPPGGLPRTGDGWQERVHPADLPRVRRTLERAVRNRVQFAVEYRMKRADGRYITVEDRGHILTDDDNVPTDVVGTIRDVTRERAALQALRDSHELYESLFRRAANPALRIDSEGNIVDANTAALELLCLAESELGRLNVRDLIEGAEGVDPLVEVSSSETSSTVVRARTPAGIRHLLVTIVPCEVEGGEHRFVLGTDVTSLRSMQDALEASKVTLEEQAQALIDRNTALRIVMEQREEDRRTLEQRLSANVRELVLPSIERLRRSLGSRPESIHLSVLQDTISGIAGSSGTGRVRDLPPDVLLTRRETEVLDLVGLGRGTAQIAEALFLSPATVSFHRRNIRRKLGLSRHHPHLSTYLATPSGNAPSRGDAED